MNWKIAFWIVLTILILENIFILWGYSMVLSEEKQTLECYYEVCQDYPDAQLTSEGVCHCYDYDVLGNPIIVKSEVMR